MFCRKCGAELRDDDASCSRCGAKVLRDAPHLVREDTPPAAEESVTTASGGGEQAAPQVSADTATREDDKRPVRYGFGKSVLRFVVCMVALAICDTVIYTMFPDSAPLTGFLRVRTG